MSGSDIVFTLIGEHSMSSTIESKPAINLSDLQKQIIESVRTGKSLLGKEGALTPLIKQALEPVQSLNCCDKIAL